MGNWDETETCHRPELDGNALCGAGLSLGKAPSLSQRETAENYSGELVRKKKFRVAICRDGIQWLFQRQRLRFANGGAAWDTLGYCTTKNALIRLLRSHMGADAPDLSTFPEAIGARPLR